MTLTAISDSMVDELVAILGPEGVLTSAGPLQPDPGAGAIPVQKWSEYVPAGRLATDRRAGERGRQARQPSPDPDHPRAGGTGLNDGAMPLKRGIVVDVKLMNQIEEIDLVDRTVTVGPGINMLKLNEVLRKHGVMYPDDPRATRARSSAGASARPLVAHRRSLRPHP